ncbi:MAG: hypothetical protein NTV01_21685 [Bacteroidia bacterium]|nr:hypothetical protein [Bacteroidia bacterium]
MNAIPRQIAGFSDFRNAMLEDIRSKTPLYLWRAREGDDPGIMLLEMWAYICDSIAFYDEVIANEAYIRTARQRASVNKLASLLGYLPRPAVASAVSLAAIADGRQLLKIPAGTAFRSGAFNGNPPQVFETSRDLFIHPLTNRWSIEPPISQTVVKANPSDLLLIPLTSITAGMILFLNDSGDDSQNQVLKVKEAVRFTTANKILCSRVSFESGIVLADTTPLSRIKLSYPAQNATILGIRDDEITGIRNNTLILDKLYPEMVEGEPVLISRGKEFRWFTSNLIGVADVKASKDTTININNITYQIVGNTIRASKLVLSREINLKIGGEIEEATWETANCGELLLHFNMHPAGQVVNEPGTTLYSADMLSLKDPVEKPIDNFNPESFLLFDKNNLGLGVKAHVEFKDKFLKLNQGEKWNGPLTLPVEVFGNVIEATRGETVRQEVLGSGDASQTGQTFKLKKKPLTYLFSPSAENDQAVKSVLEVRVNGIVWKEIANFYTASGFDQSYIVRQDEEGETYITFGDGISGQRLPSGKDNVIAAYRFGGGKAAPPAESVTQIATPLKGLKSILNPVAAGGGADPESAEEIRTTVPKSAMLLGRIISIRDVEAAVSSVPGVRAFQVEWRWSKTRQFPMVHVFYIGELSIRTSIIQRLNAISDPGISYQVEQAINLPVSVVIDLSIDQRYNKEERFAAARECLMNPADGLLSPEVIGIGKPIYRSRLYEALISIEGILGVGDISWNGQAFREFAKCPEAGQYFDVETGGLIVK